MTKILNLAFGGTGVDVTAFAGALKEFSKKQKLSTIKRVVGSSAGSLIALMVALNYGIDEIEKFCKEQLIPRKLENRAQAGSGPEYNGEHLETCISKLIRDKTLSAKADLTFQDLTKFNFKELHIATTMLFTQDSTPKKGAHIFSAENTPNTKVIDAVMAAASIPGLFHIVLLMKSPDGSWKKKPIHEDKDAYHHLSRSLVMEDFFDHPKYLSTNLRNPRHDNINLETLSFYSFTGLNNQAAWRPIRNHEHGESLYALNEPQEEEIEKLITRIKTEPVKRTVLILNQNPTKYADNNTPSPKEALLAAGEVAMRVFNDEQKDKLLAIPEGDEKTDMSSTQTHRDRFFNRTPPQQPSLLNVNLASQPEAAADKKEEKAKNCRLM